MRARHAHERAANVVLLCVPLRLSCATSPKIKKGKDEHPHKIDEVPVQAGDFDDLVMPLPAREKAGPFDIEVSPPTLSRDGDQKNHADGHVGAVEAGDHEKA